MKTYLSNTDVKEIYVLVKGTEEGFSRLKKDTLEIADRSETGAFIYKDEARLFMIFQKHLRKEMEALRIDCFGRLMQYIS